MVADYIVGSPAPRPRLLSTTSLVISNQTSAEPLQIALAQRQAGRSVIPVRNTRHKDQRVPLVKWARYQNELPTEADLCQWWRQWPDANPVIVTGKISGFFALDIDSAAGLDWLQGLGIPETFAVSRGDPVRRHLWFTYPGFHVSNTTLHEGVEVKGDGGTIPAPGAIHWSGAAYRATCDVPIAPAPDWLIDLLRPKPTPPQPARRIVSIAEDRLHAYGRGGLVKLCARVTGAAPNDAHNQLLLASAAAGRLVGAGALDEAEAYQALLDAAEARGHGRETRTIRDGLKHGETQPRDLSHLERVRLEPARVRRDTRQIITGDDLPTFPARLEHVSAARQAAPADETAKMCKGSLVSISDVINLLGSDDPKRALTAIPIKGQSARTDRRNRATAKKCNQYKSQTPLTENGRLAASDSKRLARLRVAYPQHDKLTALIPLADLCAALFADALSDDEAGELRELPALQTLNGNQQRGLRRGQRLLKHVDSLEKRLADVPFMPPEDSDIRNLPDLKAELLGQICDALAEVDPVTGDKVCKLSNRVQACLLCVSTSALPAIRARRGIVQTHKPTLERPIRPGDPLPPGTFKIRARGQAGDWKGDMYDLDSPATTAAIRSHAAQEHVVYAVVNPVAELRVGPRPERRARHIHKNFEYDQDWPAAPYVQVQPAEGKAQPKVAQPRRPWHEVYAAQLTRNILYHLGVQADAGEPLADLAGKLRSIIRPGATWIERSDPDRQDIDSKQDQPSSNDLTKPDIAHEGDPILDFCINELGGTVYAVTAPDHPGAALWAKHQSFTDLNKRDDWWQSLDAVDRGDLLNYRYHILRSKTA